MKWLGCSKRCVGGCEVSMCKREWSKGVVGWHSEGGRELGCGWMKWWGRVEEGIGGACR